MFLCLVIVVFAAFWLGTAPWEGTGRPSDTSAEAGFVRDMSVHHAQAVEMSELIRFRTRDPVLRIIASDIALIQQGQIGRVSGWLDEWQLAPTGPDPAMAWMGHPTTGLMPGMASRAQLTRIGEAPRAEAEVQFLRAMIRHHQAAILMAEAILDRTDHPAVSRFAQGIIDAQRSEITAMRQLLRDRSASVFTAPVTMPNVHGDEGDDAFVDLGMTARMLPLAAGVLAATWLGVEWVRRRRPRGSAPGEPAPQARWLLGGVALGVVGVVQLGMAPARFDESTALGVFFVAAAIVELVLAVVIATWPRREPRLL